ncbi:BatA domain-containing protein [Rubinisphaera sp.]|uniref:BatA domain-containing protein n=1 Tax=Rubinisphaera sp. TaxID=2024857 RepID=UPI000C0C9658|nr:BatA domain-containing protein [Rubinisphaera sp.]MBV11928.1 hypothetical protein [Rubinisphaera sp.]|tara:strand:+ start:1140 stop:3638 length:2499 start_codon:yes stop_codon:yes gene_type:complete
MSVLHPALLLGLALAAIPVVLHFLMRARPKKLDFPALRLLANIKKQSVQRLRLRHVGLLLLRILVLILIVLAVARPTLPAANYGLNSGEWMRLIFVGILAAIGYGLGKHYWARKPTAQYQRRWRNTCLNSATVVGTILLALLIVAWPYQQRVFAELGNPEGPRQLNVPAAAVLLFDVSASMGYQHENQNRIETARKLALEQVRTFPSGSKVAISDNGTLRPVKFLNELNAAETRLQKTDGMRPRDASDLLNETVIAAIQLQNDDRDRVLTEAGGEDADDRFLREIYIYTDRLSSAWQLEEASRLRAELERAPWLRIYVIDVGIDDATNYGLSNLSLSRERVVQGSLVRVTADVVNQSPDETNCLVELLLDDGSGTLIKRDQKMVTVPPDQTSQIAMTFVAEKNGAFQGELKLATSDPLSADDTLPFSVFVQPRETIWIVSEKPEEAFVWQQALAPNGLVERNAHQYEVKMYSPQQVASQLDQANIAPPDVIYLLNVELLSSTAWDRLRNYVRTGGGLGIILGSTRIDSLNYTEYAQLEWIPGKPTVHSRANPPATLEIVRPDHPVFSYLDQLDALSLFSTAGIRRYFKMEPSVESSVLARFSDSERNPAVIVRSFGQGQTLMIATAVDLADASRQKNWSDLAQLRWIFAAWADQTTRFLAGGQKSPLNRTVGSPMFIEVPAEASREKALLRMPGLRQNQIEIPFRSDRLVISSARNEADSQNQMDNTRQEDISIGTAGNYRLLFPSNAISDYGFSLQLNDNETNMSRLTFGELDELFGENRWQLSRSFEELERSVLLGRIGIEAYPLLMTLLIIFFLSEHLVANLFYRTEGT